MSAQPSLAHDDAMPPGPYSVGLYSGPRGLTRPYVILAANGQAVAGHVESRDCADRIAAALNRVFPA